MKYYVWLGEPRAFEINFPDRSFNGYFMVEGEPVIGWREHLIAVYLCEKTPDFQFGITQGWPIFSPRMRKLIESKAPRVVQFLPFRFQRLDGTDQVTGYFVGQILRLIDCLDRGRTKVGKNWEPVNEWGDFDTCSPLVLSRALTGKERLFRIKGSCGTIVIREDLKDAIESAKFKDQRFDLLETSP